MSRTGPVRSALEALRTHGLAVGLFVVIAVILLRGIGSTDDASRTEQLEMLRNSLRRAIVSCYAVEGSYPESVDYIVENYGVVIDESKFRVYYDIFGSNIMPSFDVLPVGDSEVEP
ncbi:MAG: hypothetical protein LBS51_03060 [Oscillospiraceae bacterium]|nr:hypothetical protein [Oscillospiraceae bacterium]